MKRKIEFIISCVLIMLILSSCGSISDIKLPDLPSQDTSSEIQPEDELPAAEKTVEEEPEITDTDITAVIVSGDEFETVFQAPDDSGKNILTFSYSTPVINIDGNPDASIAVNDFLDSIDEVYYSGNDRYSGVNYYHELAIDNYSYVCETGKDINTDFYSIRKFTCRRCDAAVISFVYTTYDYVGVASENYTSEAFNFSTNNGAVLQFTDITEDPEALFDVCAEYLNDTDLVNDDGIQTLAAENGWFLDGEGLNFLTPRYSSLLDTEAYSIPYDVIAELLKPEFIICDYSAGSTESVSLVSSDDFTENTLNIIDRVIIDDTADSSFLVINGTVRDISVSSVEYNDSDGSFFITNTIWFCSILTDSAVQLELNPPVGIPEIMISYTDGNGDFCQFLAAEGEQSGSVVLTDEAIVPLG